MRRLLALLLLAAAPAAAQPADETAAYYVGRPILALAGHPDAVALLRQVSGGHQRALAAALRAPGPPIALADGRLLYAHACLPAGCAVDGVFFGFDMVSARLYLLLTRDGSLVLQVPPRRAPWPAALEAPVAAFGAAPRHLTFDSP